MKFTKTTIAVIVVVLVVAGVVAAMLLTGDKTDNSMANMPNDTQTKSATDTSPAVATTKVDIKDFAYAPAAIKVKVGDTVTWTNQDSVQHTVTADGGDGPSSELLPQGQSYSFTFTKAGTYSYHCQVHPSMIGTVIVSE